MNFTKLEHYVRDSKLISPGDRILVAVSGGPDSTALLHVLHGMRLDLRLRLEVAHLQHGLRGEEAREDARFVRALAESLDLPFHLREIDVQRIKLEAGRGNVEALARAERYRFFAATVEDRNLDKAATAHTLDDQAETALMWFLRGSGLRGMGAMPPLSQLASNQRMLLVIRPFLQASKKEIAACLDEAGLSYRVDSTNGDPRFLRNWLRLEVLPELQRQLDDRLPGRLARQASIFREEDALLEDMSRLRLAALTTGGAIDRNAFLVEKKAMQRRILRHWIEQKKGHSRGLDFIHIEESLRLIAAERPHGSAALPGGWELLREYDRLTLARVTRERAACYLYPLVLGKMLRISEARLEIISEPARTPWAMPQTPFEAIFDAAHLGPLSLRNFRRGDRFRPLGMEGRKKIKDLFIERRVPLSARRRWPLLVCGDEILWIPGHGRSAAAPVSAETALAWRVSARPLEG